MSAVVGIDLGGTRLRAARADGAGEPSALGATEPAPATTDALRERIAARVEEAGGDVHAVGITIPGLVDGTRCRWVPNLPYLDGIDLAEVLSPLGVAVVAGNDAHLALLAETTLGAAVGVRDAVLVAIGTGIGSAVLCEGRIVRGSRSGAVSLGWATGDADDPGHPRSGWLERHASGRALDTLGAALDPPVDGRGLVEAARAGDAAALAGVRAVAEPLGAALAGSVALLDPEVVLLAGGVADAIDVLGPLLSEAMDRRLPAHLRGTPLRAGTFGSRAGVVGAVVAAQRGALWWEVRT
jgi:glucokinase